MMIFIYLSLPFVAAIAILFLLSLRQGGPWDGLAYVYVGILTLSAWGGVTVLYCAYLVIRNGLTTGSIIPGLVLIAAIAVAAVWGWNKFQDDRACNNAKTFYEELAAAGLSARTALIAAGEDIVRHDTPCSQDAFFYWFGHDKFDPDARTVADEATRLATLQSLLQAGFPSTDQVFRQAVNDGDAGFVAVLIARRAELNRSADDILDPTPAEFAFYAVDQIDLDPNSVYYPFTQSFVAILDHLVAGGLDLCTRDPYGNTLAERMAKKGVTLAEQPPVCD